MPEKELNHLKEHYSDKSIAQKYMERRLGYPIGQYRQEMQVRAIGEIIEHYNVKNLLEIAPGPGRLTAEVQVERGLAIDSSNEMLKLARANVPSDNWEFKLGNALQLNTGQTFDMAMAFRFVWHLQRDQRIQLYTSINNNLSEKGLWVFDAIYHRPLYLGSMIRKKNTGILDCRFKNIEEVQGELDEAGFKIVHHYTYLNHTNLQHIIGRIGQKAIKPTVRLIRAIDKLPLRFAQEGVVVCQKK